MKKFSFLIAILLSLVFAACDSTADYSADPMTDKEKAAAALKLLNDGLENATAKSVSDKADTGIDFSILTGTVYNHDGMKIDAAPVLEPGTLSLTLGVELTFIMTDYLLKATDPSTGSETELGSVSGVLKVIIGLEQDILSSNLVIIANTPAENQLVFTGGQLDATKVGFDNVKISIDASSITGGISLGGSPFAVKGTIIVNDFPVYVDSEIIELLMGMM